MIKKDKKFKWTAEAIESFSRFKMAFAEAPVLDSPDFQRPFLNFSFASPNTVEIVLLQKNYEEKKILITFFSKVLRDVELKYNIMEK